MVCVLIVHLAALYLPGTPQPGRFDIPGLDKVVHVALFAVPAFVLRRVTSRWWPIVALVVHAPVSELAQWAWVPYRSGDPLDLVADLAGVALGVWGATLAESAHGRVAGSDRTA